MSGKTEKKLRRVQAKAYSKQSQLWFEEVSSEPLKNRLILCVALITRGKLHPSIAIPIFVLVPIGLLIGAYVAG